MKKWQLSNVLIAEKILATERKLVLIVDALLKKKKLKKYFPEDYPASKCERIITELLEKWKAEQGEEGNV